MTPAAAVAATAEIASARNPVRWRAFCQVLRPHFRPAVDVTARILRISPCSLSLVLGYRRGMAVPYRIELRAALAPRTVSAP